MVDDVWPEIEDWIKYKLQLSLFEPIIEDNEEPEYKNYYLKPF